MQQNPLVLEYMNALRALPELRDDNRDDIGISFPIPEKQDVDRLHFFFYPSELLSANNIRLGRPLARVTVVLPAFTMERLVVENPFPDVGGQFPTTITNDFGEAVAFELDALYSIYETILHQYPQPQPEFIMSRFRELFTQFVPEPLLPFYRALNPYFADWSGL